jgi:hypothetical protein
MVDGDVLNNREEKILDESALARMRKESSVGSEPISVKSTRKRSKQSMESCPVDVLSHMHDLEKVRKESSVGSEAIAVKTTRRHSLGADAVKATRSRKLSGHGLPLANVLGSFSIKTNDRNKEERKSLKDSIDLENVSDLCESEPSSPQNPPPGEVSPTAVTLLRQACPQQCPKCKGTGKRGLFGTTCAACRGTGEKVMETE